MKKILLILIIFLNLTCLAQTLKANISKSYVPKGFYGSWAVVSVLKSTNNPNIFNYTSKDIWTLSGYGNVLILENLESGARSEITINEENKDGITLKFYRQKTVNSGFEKKIFKETVKFVLDGNKFSGSDNFIVENYNKDNKLIQTNSALYDVKGTRFAGNNP